MANIILGGQTIKAVAQQREIPCLVHFTRVENLPGILRQGLLPVAAAQRFGVRPLINDELRLDECPDATSLSIGFPNAPMFYKYRCRSSDLGWVVLELEPAVLWTKPSLFCSQNAASSAMRWQTRAQRSTVEAFRGMYEDVVGTHVRGRQPLQCFDPTDVQAEVLVTDVIEPQFIRRAVFCHPAVRDHYLPFLAGLHTQIDRPGRGYFADRTCARTHG